MKKLLAPLAVSLACATQPAVEETHVLDQIDGKSAHGQTIKPQIDYPKPNAPHFSNSEMKLLIHLAQINKEVRDLLKSSRAEIEKLMTACEMERRGLNSGERVCTPYMLETAQAQFCRFDKRITSSVAQLEQHYSNKSEEGRELLAGIQRTMVELRKMWEDFFARYLSRSGC